MAFTDIRVFLGLQQPSYLVVKSKGDRNKTLAVTRGRWGQIQAGVKGKLPPVEEGGLFPSVKVTC